jgi:hypothetical protein
MSSNRDEFNEAIDQIADLTKSFKNLRVHFYTVSGDRFTGIVDRVHDNVVRLTEVVISRVNGDIEAVNEFFLGLHYVVGLTPSGFIPT